MARLRLTRALSKYGIARNDVLSSNLHRDSATSLVNTSKAAMQQQTFIHNAANFESRACQVPEIHLLGLQQANIGRDLTGSADAVMQIYGSWHKRSMTGGAAWILKDEKLKSVDGGCLQSYASSSLQMEILACLHGIKWAKARQIRNVYETGMDMMISKRSEQVIWSRVTLSLNIEEGPCPCMSCIVTFATSSTATLCEASAWHVG